MLTFFFGIMLGLSVATRFQCVSDFIKSTYCNEPMLMALPPTHIFTWASPVVDTFWMPIMLVGRMVHKVHTELTSVYAVYLKAKEKLQ